ncbi:MAG: hypothetical protein KME60_21900 [Cyanomargarita calcarea GSE-NOS-MK-12-04C]|uniref:Uncharacterized protein n=1 Tax=Cyanomargarita calcarea GSE-NOS-MK-12-04C TaxID=2839659 RepID=A0A951QQW0_9CYAN|nr:hypothetical protein [Cyanomargarita calcarea GSE-NOS-MK-12-04C]
MRSRIVSLQLPVDVHKQAKREISRLERVGSSSSEGGVIRTYLDWFRNHSTFRLFRRRKISDRLSTHETSSTQ